MTLNDVYKIADEIAPKALSDALCSKYGMYDNSGVLVDTGKSVDGILFSLDFSLGAIAAAIKAKRRLIVTHHPAIYGKIGNLVGGESCHGVRDVLGTGGKLIQAIENGISVLSMHLNLDCADGGIDESLMRGAMLSAARANGRAYYHERYHQTHLFSSRLRRRQRANHRRRAKILSRTRRKKSVC